MSNFVQGIMFSYKLTENRTRGKSVWLIIRPMRVDLSFSRFQHRKRKAPIPPTFSKIRFARIPSRLKLAVRFHKSKTKSDSNSNSVPTPVLVSDDPNFVNGAQKPTEESQATSPKLPYEVVTESTFVYKADFEYWIQGTFLCTWFNLQIRLSNYSHKITASGRFL